MILFAKVVYNYGMLNMNLSTDKINHLSHIVNGNITDDDDCDIVVNGVLILFSTS